MPELLQELLGRSLVEACLGVRIDDFIWQDHAVCNRHQGLGAGVGDHLGVDLAAALEDTEEGNLADDATPTLPPP